MSYQGKRFFFFLLEDSFFGFEVVVVGGHALEAVLPPDPAAADPVDPVAGVQAVEPWAPAAPVAAWSGAAGAGVSFPPTVAPPLVLSALPGAPCVGESGPFVPTVASPVVPVAGTSEVAVALPCVPGVTVATTAVVPAPAPTLIVPGVNDSPPASPGGSRFGMPTWAAVATSGPFFSIPSGFMISRSWEIGRAHV